jgi:hypothetical protein
MVVHMSTARPRSAGVTAAATLAILGGVSALLIWGNIFLKLLNFPPDLRGRHFYEAHTAAFLLIALVPTGLIALGIRTGIGLFQLRSWARSAALLLAALALVFCLTVIAFRPFETFFISDHFVSEVESLKQLIVISFIFMLLPMSIWWLFFFRLESVKAQFGATEAENGGQEAAVTNKA